MVAGVTAGALAVGGAAVIGLTTGANPAGAAPGNPGTPGDPATLYVEDFENGSGVTTLGDYQSSSGVAYTADNYWLDTSQCNGFILSFNDATQPAGYCQSFGGTPDYYATRVKAQALGLLNDPQNPDTNRALSTNTSPLTANGGSPPNEIEFETAGQIPLASATSRYITFSVDAASTSCGQGAPLLRFYFRNSAGVETPVSTSAINPCTDPGAQTTPDGVTHYGRFAANSSTLVTGDSVGIVLRNESNQAAQGNDGAIDNIRVLDATPQLDKAFAPATILPGGVSTATFTITNTAELAAKNGWSFSDALPAGVVVANPAAAASTCGAGAVTATAGSATVAATGNLAAGQASCTVTVNVTASTVGSYTNQPQNVTVTGLNEPGPATLTVAGPIVTCSSDANVFNTAYNAATGGILADGSADPGWQVAGGYNGFNYPNGTTPLTAVSPPPADAAFVQARVGKVNPLWADSPYGNANWISAQFPGDANGQNQATGQADWYYRYQFTLDPAVDPSNFALAINFLADNTVSEVYVNGVAQSGKTTGLPQAPGTDGNPYVGAGFLLAGAAQTTLTSDWKTGANSIVVQMKSEYPAEGFDAQVRPAALCPNPSYSVTKTASAAVATPGDTITYSVAVHNTGNVDYTADMPATFTDNLSGVLDDATYNNDATGGAAVTGTTLAWSGAVPVGQTVTVTYSVTVKDPDTGDKALNNAIVTPSTSAGGCPSGSTTAGCRTSTPVRSFAVNKTADQNRLRPGEKVTYTITVTNTGKADYTDADPASFTDDLTAVLDDATYNTDATASAGTATYAAPTLSWSGALAVGATATITYSVTVNTPDAGDQHLDNTVVTPAGSGGDCPTGSTNPHCGVTVPSAMLQVKKTASTDVVSPGQKITYTVTVTNTGQTDFTDTDPATFTDDLSGVLDDAVYDGDGSDGVTVTGATLTWSGALKAGATVKVTYSVTVKNPDSGDHDLKNTVTVPGDIQSNCPGTDCATETPVASYTAVKKASVATAHPGDTVTYTVTVTNTGAFAYTSTRPARFSDNLTEVLDDAAYNNDAATTAGTLNYAAPTLSWSGGLPVKGHVTITYSVTVHDPDAGDGQLHNVITTPANGGGNGGDPANCPTHSTDPDCQTMTGIEAATQTQPPANPPAANPPAGNGGGLAFTGNNTLLQVLGGVLMLGAGAVLIPLGRRRRRA